MDYGFATGFQRTLPSFLGHGFKLAPVVGKILAELALSSPLSYSLSPFAIERFSDSFQVKIKSTVNH